VIIPYVKFGLAVLRYAAEMLGIYALGDRFM
jgi:hypothetical protein